jgi:hypothetical protein
MGTENGTATMENSMKGPKKLKIELPYHLAIPPLGTYLKKIEKYILKRYFHTHVHGSLIY